MENTVTQFIDRLGQEVIPNVNLFFGDDLISKEEVITKIINICIPTEESRAYDLDVMHGQDLKGQDLSEICSTFPLYSPRRFILIKGAEKIQIAAIPAIHDQLKVKNEQSLIVFRVDLKEKDFIYSETKQSKRLEFFNVLKKWDHCQVVHFNAPYENKTFEWIQQRVKTKYNKTISSADAQFLVKRLGADLAPLENVLNKLNIFLEEDQPIKRETLEFLTSDSRVYSIDELIVSIFSKKYMLALKILQGFNEQGMPDQLILNKILEQIKLLLKYKSVEQKGWKDEELSQYVGIHSRYWFVVKDSIRLQAQSTTIPQLLRAFEQLFVADLAIKTGKKGNTEAIQDFILAVGQSSIVNNKG